MNTLANLFAYYNNGEQDVYHFVLGKILENTELFLQGSIYEIADYCSASTATISRLAQKLGYKNFSDFRHNLFDARHYFRYNNQVMPNESKLPEGELPQNYFKYLRDMIGRVEVAVTEQDIEHVADMLHNAAHVRIFTFNTGYTEVGLQINLLMSGKESLRCDRFMDQIIAAKKLNAEDVVLIMAPDCSDALDIIPLAQIVQEKGAQSILITNSTHSVHLGRVDFSIAFDGNNTNMDLWGMYMIVDLISLRYRKKYVE